MRNSQSPTSQLTGNQPGNTRQAILHDVLQTREVRQLLIRVLPEMMNVWSGNSWWKRTIARTTGHTIAKQLSFPEDALNKNEIRLLLEDETFIKNVADQLPELLNGFSGILETATQTLEKLSSQQKKNIVSGLLTDTGKGRTGLLLTRCCRMLNDIHQEDPEFFARILESGFKQWIEAMDFGELKEALENSAQDTRALITMANNVIWEYPAKVVLMLSLLPTMTNSAAEAIEVSVGKLNTVPPDLLTDIVLAFMKEIDVGTVARVFTELTEVLRKIHTGSALLGEPGTPQLPKVLAEVFDAFITKTDPAAVWKARVTLAELKAVFNQELSQTVGNHTEHVRLGMKNKPELFNIRMRSKNQKLNFWDVLDDDELADCMARLLSGYDVQAAAEVFNNVLTIANRLYVHKPDICVKFLRQVIDAVDYDELANAARQVLGEMREDIRPAARAVVPSLVEWVCDTLQPQDDEFEEDAARARSALRELLIEEDVS